MRKMLKRFRRFTMFAGATALAAGVLTAVFAGPAAAQGDINLLLANASGYGAYAQQGVTLGSNIAVKHDSGGTWELANASSWSADGVTGTSLEIKSVTTSGVTSNLCLASDLGTSYTYLNTCGANGTYWVSVSNGDGDFLYNRYYLDEDDQQVLAAYDPSAGPSAQIIPPSEVGGDWFGRWIGTPIS